MKKLTFFILFLITVIGFSIRFYKLSSVPPSLDWDEVSLGYNAYSVLHTGRDEYGNFLPLTFKSFGDYKPPLYVYITVPSIYAFGLNEFAVRFPSAFLGALSVPIVFLLVRELFKRNKLPLAEASGIPQVEKFVFLRLAPDQNNLALLASLFFAISPWHIQFSHAAFEANVSLFFILLGTLLFFLFLRRGPVLVLSAVSYVFSMYSYHSAKIFVPLLVLGLAFIFRKELVSVKKWIVLSFLVGLLLMIPSFFVLTSGEGLSRFRGVSQFSDPTPILQKSLQEQNDDLKENLWLGTVIHNRRIVYSLLTLKGYLSHLDFNFLFVNADAARHHAPDMGLLYLWELPFVIFGIYKLLTINGKERSAVFWWFLIAPVAASVTNETPHAIRTLVFLPTFQIFTALGVLTFWSFSKERFSYFVHMIVIGFIGFLFVFNVIFYLHQYFVHMNIEYSEFWQYGYKDAVSYVEKVYSSYDRILISDKLEQPQIFFLFYSKYDPEKYLKEGGTKIGSQGYSFGKFYFGKIDKNGEKGKRTLYVGAPEEFSTDGAYVSYLLNGKPAIIITDNLK